MIQILSIIKFFISEQECTFSRDYYRGDKISESSAMQRTVPLI